MTAHKHSDFGAAMAGLIVGGCLVYAITFGIVQLTNLKFAKHKPAAESTETGH